MCVTSIGLLSDEKDIVAFACFHYHPNVPSVPPWEWQTWVYNIYNLSTVNAYNTLWLHFAKRETFVAPTYMKLILKYLFTCRPLLQYVLMVVPPNYNKISTLETFATKISAKGIDALWFSCKPFCFKANCVKDYFVLRLP